MQFKISSAVCVIKLNQSNLIARIIAQMWMFTFIVPSYILVEWNALRQNRYDHIYNSTVHRRINLYKWNTNRIDDIIKMFDRVLTPNKSNGIGQYCRQ